MATSRPDALIPWLVERSIAVFESCLLPNGCLVAAPSHLPIYPKRAKSYLYCWPGRDLGFSLAAMESLGRQVRQPLLGWIWERAESFQQTGLLYEEYHPNGPRRGPEWQPDQAGTLLWALSRAPSLDDELELNVVTKLADGLVAMWTGAGFHVRYRDLWERRFASPLHGSNFTYSLAACATGLRLAGEAYGVEGWRTVAAQLAARLPESWDDVAGHHRRRFGPVGNDSNLDASLLGLAWPFSLSDDSSVVATVRAIEQTLAGPLGVQRYQFDGYDGEVELIGAELRQGAGAWPLLTFWLALVQHQLGDRDAALATYRLGLASADSEGYFPEMVFAPGDSRVGVKPLLWSHMMFVLATAELGLLPDVT